MPRDGRKRKGRDVTGVAATELRNQTSDQVAAEAAEQTNPDAEVQRIREQSFEDFYRNHRDHMFRALSLTLGDHHLAAEAADEAMVRTYQHWRKVRDYRNPSGWTYRVGLNWARSRLRRAKREQPGVIPEIPRDDPEGTDPMLVQMIESLPLPSRSVVVMRYYLQWSHEEIAEALDVPIGTVKSRIHRAVADLRDRLGVEQ